MTEPETQVKHRQIEQNRNAVSDEHRQIGMAGAVPNPKAVACQQNQEHKWRYIRRLLFFNRFNDLRYAGRRRTGPGRDADDFG